MDTFLIYMCTPFISSVYALCARMRSFAGNSVSCLLGYPVPQSFRLYVDIKQMCC